MIYFTAFNISNQGLKIIDNIIDIYLITDLFINFNTAITIDGNIITNWKIIANNYLKSYFFFDLISSIPYSFIDYGRNNQIKILNIINLVKLIKIFKLINLLSIYNIIERFETG